MKVIKCIAGLKGEGRAASCDFKTVARANMLACLFCSCVRASFASLCFIPFFDLLLT